MMPTNTTYNRLSSDKPHSAIVVYKDELSKSLDVMPNVFSSIMFSLQAKKNGLDSELMGKYSLASLYLQSRKDVVRVSKRTWKKKTKKDINDEAEIVEQKEMTEKEAIKLLKSLGYKILKPNIQFEEI